MALGARAAAIDQVGSSKRVIVYGSSTPRRALPARRGLTVQVSSCSTLLQPWQLNLAFYGTANLRPTSLVV